MNEKNLVRSFLGVCLVIYLGLCLPQIPVAADDIRMVEVFSMDEASAASLLKQMISEDMHSESARRLLMIYFGERVDR
jgi:hypothetical protein